MTRIVLEPGTMEQAAARLTTTAEELERLGAAIRAPELPAMPAGMAARYAAGIEAVALRTARLGAPVAEVAAELRRRAAAARAAADGPSSGAAGRRVAAALAVPADAAVRAGGAVASPEHASAQAAVPAGAHEAVGGHAARAVHDAVSAETAHAQGPPAAGHAGDGLRAAAHDGAGSLAPVAMPHHGAAAHEWACWIASHAAHSHLPPALPLAMALAGSGLRNLGLHGDGVGLFGIRAGADPAPAGFGLASTAQPDAAWWHHNPDAQLAHVLARLEAVAPPEPPGDADGLGKWAGVAQSGTDAGAVAGQLSAARALVARCRHGLDHPAVGDAHPSSALDVAQTQLGVHETGGANVGPQVDRYLASADVAPGNPWCASFVTWALRQSGHQMPGAGWAGVAHWVQSAQQHAHGLTLVSPQDAHPGDIVAYDWGGGNDFGQDGHIGFLASPVGADGAFTAIEGNAGDAVARMHRRLDEAHVVFIRAHAA
jgi:hypothetical protein